MLPSADLTPELLEEFIEIANRAWIQDQLEKYEVFRQQYSPEGYWSHRPPSMSPAIPLVYWSSKTPYQPTGEGPMGYWYGESTHILGHLAAYLMDFRYYWESLPNKIGLENIRWCLRTPSRFASFMHEMRTASTYDARTPYEVEPKFFDPRSKLGEPDIILKKGDRTFNVQCKAMDPSISSTMPFELFNYLNGCFSRVCQDHNIHGYLSLILKEQKSEPLTRRDLDNVITKLRQSIESERKVIGPFSFDWGDCAFNFEKSKKPLPRHMKDHFYIWNKEYLFRLRRTFPLKKSSTGNVTTTCQVSGGYIPSFESYIYPKFEQSAKVSSKTIPLIICIHLYPHVPVQEYIRIPQIQKKGRPDLERYLDRNRHVCLILISSNAQQLFWLGGDQGAIATPAWEIESQHWSGERPDYDPSAPYR